MQLYLFEGLVYDLFAAVVGVLLGVAVAFGMVFILASALDFTGGDQATSIESLVVGFGVGVLLAFVIVTLSAVSVSRLNIVAAIRNTPEPVARSRKRRWILGTLAVLAGIFPRSVSSSADAASFMLGVSLVLVGAAAGAGRRAL